MQGGHGVNMDKKIYIKKSVYITEDIIDRDGIDKNIDGIGGLCIAAIRELFRNLPDALKDVPVFFGSAYSSLNSLHNFNIICEQLGALRVNPSLFPNTVLNSPFCRASIYHGITSPVYNISNGRFSGLEAFELAFMHIINGETDNAIVCTAEEGCDFIRRIEKKEISNSCGALYLTALGGEIEIQSLSRKRAGNFHEMDNSDMDSTNILEIINNTYKEKAVEKELILENIQGYKTVINIRYHNRK